jgi:hypothetical protein
METAMLTPPLRLHWMALKSPFRDALPGRSRFIMAMQAADQRPFGTVTRA